MGLDRRFADLGLGLGDGSVVALAQSLGVRRLATRDVRHFAAVRLRDGRSFDLHAGVRVHEDRHRSVSTCWAVRSAAAGCGLLALIEQASVVARILGHLGLPTEVPTPRPARASPLVDVADDVDAAREGGFEADW
jgi:hypothetical protein